MKSDNSTLMNSFFVFDDEMSTLYGVALLMAGLLKFLDAIVGEINGIEPGRTACGRSSETFGNQQILI